MIPVHVVIEEDEEGKERINSIWTIEENAKIRLRSFLNCIRVEEHNIGDVVG